MTIPTEIGMRHAAAALKEKGAEFDKLKATQKKIAEKEAQLEELAAQLERRKTSKTKKSRSTNSERKFENWSMHWSVNGTQRGRRS